MQDFVEMKRLLLMAGLVCGLFGTASAFTADELANECANPFFLRSALDALNQKNMAVHNLVTYLQVPKIRDIARGFEDYISCRVTIIDNQGLSYDGVLEWNKDDGFSFSPFGKKPTD
jgi:hypothetical protein